MRKSTKTIWTITAIGIMLVGAYLLGTTQAETITEVHTVTEIKEIIPEGYILLEECIPLRDVACCFIDGYDYICFEIGDITHQFDDESNRSYLDIMKLLPNETERFRNDFINMSQVVDFVAEGNGLQLYMEDGTGYYFER